MANVTLKAKVSYVWPAGPMDTLPTWRVLLLAVLVKLTSVDRFVRVDVNAS